MVRSGRPRGLGNLSVDRKRRGAHHRQSALPEHNGERRPRSRHSSQSCARILATSFGSDDLSLLDREHVDASRILTTEQVTDTYLLALARLHEGATFARRLVVDAVPDCTRHLEVIS
jgi:hypothetical protein